MLWGAVHLELLLETDGHQILFDGRQIPPEVAVPFGEGVQFIDFIVDAEALSTVFLLDLHDSHKSFLDSFLPFGRIFGTAVVSIVYTGLLSTNPLHAMTLFGLVHQTVERRRWHVAR